MKKAYIYARVSTEEQAEEGKSIETQIKLCSKWAKDNEYKIVGQYVDEGKSATNLNRPALKDLLSNCQEDSVVDAILVQDTDRLARNTLDHLTIKSILKKNDIQVISISQPMIDDSPEGNLIDTILASVNTFQSQITGRKTSKVMEEKAKIGWYPGGVPVIGYRNIDNPTPVTTLDRRIIAIDNDIAPHIKKIFEMYATGEYSVKALSDYLKGLNLKSKFGYSIHPSLIARTLQNKFYIGTFEWKGIEYEGKHQPLIDTELFESVQFKLKSYNQNRSRKRIHNFLLNGFARCAECNRRLSGEKHTKSNGTVCRQYACPTCKKSTYVDQDKLEEQIDNLFDEIQISKEYVQFVLDTAKKLLEENRSNQDSEKRRLQAEKAKVDKAMRELEDSRFINHTINDETFQRIYPRYQTQIENINDELNGLDKDHSKAIESLKEILRLAENIGNAYRTADYSLKRSYLNLFFKQFKIRRGKLKSYELQENVKPLIEEGSVRIRTTGLPADFLTRTEIERVIKSPTYLKALETRLDNRPV